jgi:hypothetical protein
MGSSRRETYISAPMLEKELSEKLGRPIHVANLAIPQEGRKLHFLVRGNCWRTILKPGLSDYPAFRCRECRSYPSRISLSGRLYRPSPCASTPESLFLDAAFLPYRQMNYFVLIEFPGWFGESRTFRKDYAGTGFDTTYSFYLPSGKLVDLQRRYGRCAGSIG